MENQDFSSAQCGCDVSYQALQPAATTTLATVISKKETNETCRTKVMRIRNKSIKRIQELRNF